MSAALVLVPVLLLLMCPAVAQAVPVRPAPPPVPPVPPALSA